LKRRGISLLLLVALLVVLTVVSLGTGAVSIAPGRIIEILWSERSVDQPPSDFTIIWELRFPRLLLGCLVGAGLGVAGAGYQGLFRNPLADPFVIGASGGAALGATVAIITGLNLAAPGLGTVPLAALVGALVAVAIVYSVASIGSEVPLVTLLLAGVSVSSFFGAVVSLLMYLHDEKLVTIFGWLLGSLSGRGWPVLRATAPWIFAGIGGLWLLARSLDALTFGEEAAAALGLRLGRLRGLIVLAASVATAAAVAAGGIIGFVGLISPHIARLMVGARHAFVIPASGLVGAILLVAADDLARTVTRQTELPVGVVTALLGTPFFLVLLRTRERNLGRGL
jgi:iron complex transport system permease protein